MRNGTATRQNILDEAVRQAAVFGFDGLTLGALATQLNMSKSGLFAHFKSKEALQLAVLEEGLKRFGQQVIDPIKKQERGLPRLREAFQNYLKWISGDKYAPACIFCMASQEFQTKDGALRDQLVELQQAWRSTLEYLVQQAFTDQLWMSSEDCRQVVFEMMGIALSYQQSFKLLDDTKAKGRADAAFSTLVNRYQIKRVVEAV